MCGQRGDKIFKIKGAQSLVKRRVLSSEFRLPTQDSTGSLKQTSKMNKMRCFTQVTDKNLSGGLLLVNR